VKEPSKNQNRRKVNTEILRSLRDGLLAPEDLVFLDPRELFDVLTYLMQLPFNVDAPKPTSSELNREWTSLCKRMMQEHCRKDTEPYSDFKSITQALFGEAMSSITLYMIAEIIGRYFNELICIRGIFDESNERIDSIKLSLRDIIDQIGSSDETVLIRTPLEIAINKLTEAKELNKSLLKNALLDLPDINNQIH